MKKLTLLALALVSTTLVAKDIYVDYNKGKWNNPGTQAAPLNNIDMAFRKVSAGDTIHVLPSDKPINGVIVINKDLGGTPDFPITIDGGNNIFTGEVPLKAKEWEEVEPGLFRRKFASTPNNNLRLFMIHNGHLVRMGRFTKGDGSAPLKPLAELQPGEWTIIDAKPEENKRGNERGEYEFYIKLGEGEKTLADGKWAEPKMMCGVKLTGKCTSTCPAGCTTPHIANIVIKNVIVTHVWNDGFNFHGNIGNLKIENCAAVECGDDGISAHNNVTFAAKDFVSIRNSSAICHIGNAHCTHENFYVEDSLGTDFNPQGMSVNILNDVYIKSIAKLSIYITSRGSGKAVMTNCAAVSTGPIQSRFAITRKEADVKFDNVVLGGYAVGTLPEGVAESNDIAGLTAKIAAKRAELFAKFGGNLEKACGE